MMLSDVDIRKRLNKDFIIDPFNDALVNPIGYDLTIGDLVLSKPGGLLSEEKGRYTIPAKATVQILTKENLWLSGRVAGTLHPRVSTTVKGFSHFSTTVDPGWIGPLLVTMNNLTDQPTELDAKKAFCTLLLHRLDSETTTVKRRFSFIQNTLLEQIRQQEDTFLDKVTAVVEAEYVEKMREQIKAASAGLIPAIAQRVQLNRLRRIGSLAIDGALVILAAAILAAPLYWNSVKRFFHDVDYDSTVLVGQVTSLIAILALLVSKRSR